MKRVRFNSPILPAYLLLAAILSTVYPSNIYHSVISQAHAQTNPPVLIKVESATVEGGATTTVDVIVEAGDSAVGVALIFFAYDDRAITVIDCEVEFAYLGGACNINDSGIVGIGGLASDPVSGASGTFTLLTITIAGLTDGMTDFVFSEVKALADPGGRALDYTTQDGVITVIGDGDPLPTRTPTPTLTLTPALTPALTPTSEPTPTPSGPTPTATPPVVTCGPLEQEAEDGALAGNWRIGDDANASGGQYIFTEDTDAQVVGAAQVRSTDVNRHKASYCFGVTTPGTYRVLWSVYAEDQQDNSVFYQVPGNQGIQDGIWAIPVNTRYDAVYATRKNSDLPTELTLEAGDQVLDLFLREDGARIDKISLVLVDEGGPVVPPPPPSDCQPLGQEAEDGTFFGDFGAMDDPNASGGQYVSSVFAATGSNSTGGNSTGSISTESNIAALRSTTVSSAPIRKRNRVDFCVSVAQAGEYRLRTQVMGPDHESNSFFVQVDGGPEEGTLYDIFPISDDPQNGIYVTDYVSQRGGADPVIYTLEPGDHTISFILRENGARLDSFTLEPVTVQAAAVAAPTMVELRRNLVAEEGTGTQDVNIFVPLIAR